MTQLMRDHRFLPSLIHTNNLLLQAETALDNIARLPGADEQQHIIALGMLIEQALSETEKAIAALDNPGKAG